MKLCGWFWAMDGPSKAVFLTRFSWLASMGITWIGLLPSGWELVKYVAADMSITAHYGLFKIEFFGTSNFVSDYLDWSAAQPETSSAYTYIQGVRACAVLGLAALAVQFLGSLRLWCAKDMRVRRRFTVLCTMMAALDFVFTGLALLLWKTIPRAAFLTFCSTSGCVMMPDVADAAHMTVYYSWGFYIVKGVLAFPGLVAMVYLCTGFSYDGNAEAEERHEKGLEAEKAGKELKKKLSSKKGSSSVESSNSSKRNSGSGKQQSAAAATGSGSRSSKKWHEEEEGDDGEGDEETGHAQVVAAEEEPGAGAAAAVMEEEDPWSKKKKGGASSSPAASPKGSPKGSKGSGKGGFDRQAPVTYAGGAAGNPNPSWLTG